jgi:hypothetical protein
MQARFSGRGTAGTTVSTGPGLVMPVRDTGWDTIAAGTMANRYVMVVVTVAVLQYDVL